MTINREEEQPLEKPTKEFLKSLIQYLEERCPYMRNLEKNRIESEIYEKLKDLREEIEGEILLYAKN